MHALLLYLRWTAAEDDWNNARRRLDEAHTRATELTQEAARASAAETGKAESPEAGALKDLLSVNENDVWPPLIDSLAVEPDYGMAPGAALGEYLALPVGAEPLARSVSGPDVLGRLLSQIGVVRSGTCTEQLRAKAVHRGLPKVVRAVRGCSCSRFQPRKVAPNRICAPGVVRRAG